MLELERPNKGMKLTSAEHFGRSQLIPGVGRTMRVATTAVAAGVLGVTLAAGPPVWEPPSLWPGGQFADSTVFRDFVQRLTIGTFAVELEKTSLRDVGSRFDAAVGHSGDASESVHWVCLQGEDSEGRWVLWLESSEVHGPVVGGVLLHRLAPGVDTDSRCARLHRTPVLVPVGVSLGMTKDAVLQRLGRPTAESGTTLAYSSCREITLRVQSNPEPQRFDLCSVLYIGFRRDRAEAFQVWRTTTS